MPSGYMLFPFADLPHITQEGSSFMDRTQKPGQRHIACYYIVRSQATLEAAREVLDHLQWTWEDDTPLQVFPFRALQHLEHWPTSPPAKRRAAL